MSDQAHDPAPLKPAHLHPGAVALFVLVCVAALAIDLGIKHWAFEVFPPDGVDIPAVLAGREGIPDKSAAIVPGVLAIKLTLNQGAVFGMAQGQRWFFILATFIALGVVGYFFSTTTADQSFVHIALALILAGALGNLYDRLMYAAVRDMFWLLPGVMLPFGWRWPNSHTSDIYPWLFNAADAYLLVGIVMILIRSLFTPKKPAHGGGET
ncbi:MAG: hypothetical protein GC162_02320 [Planctomycetes bacterium]|nr:hypothetical protein [Planctomycetota bacterium]